MADHDGRKTGTSWTDGARVKVEDNLDAVLVAVEAASERVVRMERETQRREEKGAPLRGAPDRAAPARLRPDS